MRTETRVPLDSVATGRTGNLFAADLTASHDRMRAAVTGKRLLVIGGAGSIGSATIAALLPFAPATLVVVDQNENALAEQVRGLRSSGKPLPVRDLRLLPLDYGGGAMRRFLAGEPAFDAVLHFAAIKHVRSEKDDFSLMQMVETNLVKLERLIGWLADSGFTGRLFAVSTDKAANPTSFMGATKRVMEHVLFQSGAARLPRATITSARFANVAFSNGSLLQSFENRLAARQALAAPRDTRRYFVSREEAGTLCAIAATAVEHGSLLAPRLDPETHLVPLEGVARRFLDRYGLAARPYEDEAEALADVETCAARGQWPLLLTPLDTGGEKPYEEFVADGEDVRDIGLDALVTITHQPAEGAALRAALARLEAMLEDIDGRRPQEVIKEAIAMVVPDFTRAHRASSHNLDQRA
jgi:FlaA1/EpsC-like NDP-sugar epimerase